MNPELTWYVTRASGIVAWILVTVSVVWGLVLSTRIAGNRPTPAWSLDVHRFAGAMSVTFVAVHLAALVADDYVHFSWTEILVPWGSTWRPTAVAWGVIACYLLVAVETSSLLMRHLPSAWWRAIHHSSFAVFVLATVHGLQAGRDVANPAYRIAGLVSVQAVAFLTILRIVAGRRARRRRERSDAQSMPTAGIVPPGIGTCGPATVGVLRANRRCREEDWRG